MVPGIPELGKLPDMDCQHLRKKRASGCCSKHGNRPASCREFQCVWIGDEGMPDSLRPDRCGVMLSAPIETPGTILVWEIDCSFQESDLKAWLDDPVRAEAVEQYEYQLVRKHKA